MATCLDQQTVLEANCDLGSQETSFADNNNIEFDARDRGTRESTPCSFIRESNDAVTPGSSTRPTSRHASNRMTQRIMPSAQEIEEFFALHAQEQQRLFSEKYNFDIVNEKPLKGRYEWVRADM
ncbi:cyclin-dependent kinase inhibitor 3-like [Bidens hawaiensis]|uniref:cyclin-dependent kinase inhibitor 3-like n=1 Tax=Bidens hawaiensis TaxID=980011 RepID=UPI00404A4D36